jgi:adenylate cyclase
LDALVFEILSISAAMPAKLRVTPAAAEPFELAIGNTATIGRTDGNTVCLSASPRVSRQHAIIRCHNGYQYQLIDLGSRTISVWSRR